MQPSNDFISRFQQIFFEEFDERLSDAEALERLTRLINVLRILIYNPPDNNSGDASFNPNLDGRP